MFEFLGCRPLKYKLSLNDDQESVLAMMLKIVIGRPLTGHRSLAMICCYAISLA